MNSLLYINWDIDPVIFSIGPVKLQYYGLIFVTACIMLLHNWSYIQEGEYLYS